MSKERDLTGQRIGKLLVIKRKRENNRTYYNCKCDCGNEKWIRSDRLVDTKKPTHSCGCLSKETQFKAEDVKGKKFGRLTVLEMTDNRTKHNYSVIWKCLCECGNTTFVSVSDLKKGAVSSCGCYRKEYRRNQGKKIGNTHIKNNIIEDTNLQVITRDKPYSSNTSGATGVIWDKDRCKWVAIITFQKKIYRLGRYNSKEEAIEVRQKAEEKLHKEFIRKLKESE